MTRPNVVKRINAKIQAISGDFLSFHLSGKGELNRIACIGWGEVYKMLWGDMMRNLGVSPN